MIKALSKDPAVLKQVLLGHREDQESAMVGITDDVERNKSLAVIAQIDEALLRLDDKVSASEEEDSSEEEPEAASDPGETEVSTDMPVVKKRKVHRGSGLGFGKPKEQEEDEDMGIDNPVAMNNRLRRDIGPQAADFLDDYAQEIHKKTKLFFEEIRTKALELGVEDDDDGITSLREMLRDEVGRRGLASIEPVFKEWRGSVFRVIAKEIRDMFAPPEAVVHLEDKQVGDLLGLDSMDDDEVADEVESDIEEATGDIEEETSEIADDAAEAALDEDEDEEEETSTVSSAIAPSDAPIAIARGRVSMRVKSRKPVSATVSAPVQTAATDFVPSGRKNTRLE